MVVVVDGLAASGGYIAAHGRRPHRGAETSLVGSIGVLFQYPNVTDLLKTVGVKVEEIKSSPLKAAPNGFEPTSPEARAAIESIVMDSYAWFRDLVKNRRELDDAGARQGRGRARVHRPAGGRAQAGRRARRRADRDRLAGQGPRTSTRRRRCATSSCAIASAICRSCTGRRRGARCAGPRLGRAARRGVGAVQAIERLNLDGLLALWHPPAAS